MGDTALRSVVFFHLQGERMMLQIHPQARTTPAVRADIARSSEPTSILARRYGISDETVRKWRRRGSDACQDRSSRPRKLVWKASEEERAIVCQLRRSTAFGLDDLTFVVRHFLPYLNRDNIWRILKDAGLNRLPPAPKAGSVRGRESSGITIPVMFISM